MAGIKDWFYAIDVISGWFPVTIWTLVAIGIVVLLICQRKGESRKRFLRQLGIGLLAGIVGLAATYVCSDVLLLFGVSLGWPVIIAIGVGVFLFAFMIAAAVMTHGWLRVLSIVMIPVTLLATAVRANAIYGEYQTMGSLFDYSPYPHISTLDLSLNTISVREWNEQAVAKSRNTTQIPQPGKLVHVDIPNPKSGFKAREALVWLPPAAFAKHPPKLPVMVMFAGQPAPPRVSSPQATQSRCWADSPPSTMVSPRLWSAPTKTRLRRATACVRTPRNGARPKRILHRTYPIGSKRTCPSTTRHHSGRSEGSRRAAHARRSWRRTIRTSTAMCWQ